MLRGDLEYRWKSCHNRGRCISYPRQDLNAGSGARRLQRLAPFSLLAVRDLWDSKEALLFPHKTCDSRVSRKGNLLAAGLSCVFWAAAYGAKSLSMLVNAAEAGLLTE